MTVSGYTKAGLDAKLNDVATATAERGKVVARYEADRRNKLPLYAGGGTVTVAGAQDASLTRSALWDSSTQADGTFRRTTATEMANFPVDTGCPDAPHYVYRTNGAAGYQFTAHVPDTSTIPANSLITVVKYRYRTNSPKSALGFWALNGVPNSYKVFIDGQQVSARTTAPGYVDFVTFAFTDGLFHEIEVRTSAMLFGAYWQATYDLVKPDVPDSRLRIYTVGDSYSQPIVFNDTTSGAGADVEGLAQGIEDYLGGGDHYVDAVGGTGFIQRFASAPYAPNNNYIDRLPSLLRAAPRIDLLLIPNGPANDVAAGQSQASIVAAIRQYLLAFRAANPKAKIVYGAGHTPPSASYATAGPTYRAIMATLQTTLADIGVYYVDNSTWLNGTGRNTAKTGTGNTDWAVGNDAVHCTGLGYRYLQARFAHKVRKALADDGSLLNTVL